MINPSFQELEKISGSRYEICVMCMKRSRLLIDHSKPLVKTKSHKPVTQALEEIMAGKIHSCEKGQAILCMKKELAEEEKVLAEDETSKKEGDKNLEEEAADQTIEEESVSARKREEDQEQDQ